MQEKRLNRLLIIGIIGIIYSIILILDYFFNDGMISQLIVALCLFISSIIFIAFRKELIIAIKNVSK